MLQHTYCLNITDYIFSELQSQRDNISRLREENRKLRSDYDELQLRYDDEVYNSGGWKKERERMDMKIADVTKAYEASVAAQTEQQSQIAALHSQVREVHSVLDDAEADRALLQKARRALQAELETIKLDHVDSSKLPTDQEFQRLQLKKQDLERTLEEQEDRVANAYGRMKKAETHANECQIELGRIRVENSELEKLNVSDHGIAWAFVSLRLDGRHISKSKIKSSTSVLWTWKRRVMRALLDQQQHVERIIGLKNWLSSLVVIVTKGRHGHPRKQNPRRKDSD